MATRVTLRFHIQFAISTSQNQAGHIAHSDLVFTQVGQTSIGKIYRMCSCDALIYCYHHHYTCTSCSQPHGAAPITFPQQHLSTAVAHGRFTNQIARRCADRIPEPPPMCPILSACSFSRPHEERSPCSRFPFAAPNLGCTAPALTLSARIS